MRPPKPGSIIIEGATVNRNRSKFVNGTFEPTDEICNGMPVYSKKGDPETWLEMVEYKSGGWRWYVKPTIERGPCSTICFGYGHSNGIVLPHDCTAAQWSVYDGKEFVIESQITCKLHPEAPLLPNKYVDMLAKRLELHKSELAHLEEEVNMIKCSQL